MSEILKEIYEMTHLFLLHQYCICIFLLFYLNLTLHPFLAHYFNPTLFNPINPSLHVYPHVSHFAFIASPIHPPFRNTYIYMIEPSFRFPYSHFLSPSIFTCSFAFDDKIYFASHENPYFRLPNSSTLFAFHL